MASAEVLPSSAAAASSSSRKQGHLEAGKRRLEEFRKKKAEGRSKKAASTGQLLSADANNYERSSLDSERVSDGATHERDGASTSEPPGAPPGAVMVDGSISVDPSHGADMGSSNSTHSNYIKNGNVLNGDWMHNSAIEDSRLYESSGFSGPVNSYDNNLRENHIELSHQRESGIELSDGVQSALNTIDANQNIYNSTNQFKPDFLVERENSKFTVQYVNDPDSSEVFQSSLTENAETAIEKEHSMDSESVGGYTTSRSKISDSISRHLNVGSTSWHASEPSSMSSSLTSKSSFNQLPFSSTISGTGSGRSRPSFLDDLNVPRVYSISPSQFTEPAKVDPPVYFDSSKLPSAAMHSLYSSQKPFLVPDTFEPSLRRTQDLFGGKELSMHSPVPINDGESLRQVDDGTWGKQDFLVTKKDEDFATLEQHIEDLTQEKFSLQRALDTSRSLAESLAAENSSLTDSFNQQGKVVNQLRSDMEQLQEEIRAQLLALESVKVEYANAQMECNAADERAKILASEVIGLEEKALRLRSNELKLEKQLERSDAEISSYKRKVSSLEKERHDFQSTIEALQEEKKLLQSKLRTASSNVSTVDTKTPAAKKVASTSTEDLDTGGTSARNSSQEIGSSVGVSSGISNFSYLTEIEDFSPPNDSGAIPHDQLKLIDNICSLISELALEKEELMRTLAMESSNNSKLKDMNKELSQKLETLTQRFELLTSQQMANENIITRPMDTSSTHGVTDFTDEGDEVVERVLGWIMKLFPGGGPAKRRSTSKFL